ncbi:ATP-binding protein [Sphingomonas sp. AR_OL41]|uniref:ATP-binding protein n=1 Tax=Sphingomonas sp. AR_OL41 TaxID=3042729 RepID=UPI00248104B6|nr:ATP-binding protein [Sphingomonas sp. AR_OL41]MDH7975375.1 ATP-binding protein [Sphingomonas sp. AR_OL41]
MFDYFQKLLGAQGLAPHGYCLLWDPALIWTHVISDALIGLAYFSIPVVLVTFITRRKDIAFSWIAWMFAAFILACGTTHFFSIWTLWRPDYGPEALVKLVTAIVSVFTAIALWVLLPRALAVPSQAQLRLVNDELLARVVERDLALAALERETAERLHAETLLRQSQKMEAVGQLTGGIAHDFNNMLAVISGSLELLERRIGEGDPRTTRYLSAASDAARRAADLTSRLLAFSRRQALQPQVIAANTLVSGMSELLRSSLGATIRLETVLAGGLWRICVDPAQLENALLNLSVNARDAMPEGGRLTIETQNAHLDDNYVADTIGLPPGQYIMIAVSDTGDGMAPEVIEQAFEPFFTTKDVGKGTGLGLSQVYGFVKQSGGHIKIYSEPGNGTTVKLYLPRHRGEEAAPAPLREEQDIPQGELSEVILVVEDEPAVRQFSVDALTDLGYRVLEADGAENALRLLAAHPEICLLFTDVVMPGVNGAQLAQQARQARPALKILFTTGYTRNAIVHNGVLEPSVELIGKPFNINDLARKIRQILDR